MKLKVKEAPKIGDKRVRSGFLFRPRTALRGRQEETRWLECATWEEQYTPVHIKGVGHTPKETVKWVPTKWLDELDKAYHYGNECFS